MWWGKKEDKPTEAAKAAAEAKKDATTPKSSTEFDPKKLPQREKLPDRLQKIIEKSDKEENFFDEVVEG